VYKCVYVNVLSLLASLCSIVVQSTSLLCRRCDLLLFCIVDGNGSSWRLVFQHRLALSAAIWDIAFLTERHLLVLQASETAAAVVCTLSVGESSTVTVLVTTCFVPLSHNSVVSSESCTVDACRDKNMLNWLFWRNGLVLGSIGNAV